MQGPFISGSVHHPWRLGQRLTLSELAAAAEPAQQQQQQRRGGRSLVSLADLIAGGLLVPGRGAVTLTFKGHSFAGDLAADGAIEADGKRFASATAFSIHCKRQVTPGKQGDDGWRSCCYGGRPLEHFRAQFLQRSGGGGGGSSGLAEPAAQQGGTAAAAARQRPQRSKRGKRRRSSDSEDDSGGIDEGSLYGWHEEEEAEEAARQAAAQAAALPVALGPSGSPLVVGGALVVDLPAGVEVEGADRWVQCDRCQTWRMVPAQHWPAVQADEREEWYCEYAQGLWDVATEAPHQPACSPDGGGGGKG